jgi:hypothetical protein
MRETIFSRIDRNENESQLEKDLEEKSKCYFLLLLIIFVL